MRQLAPVLLAAAARPRQTLVTAGALALAAALAARPAREVALVAGTVVVGQTLLAWDNDLVDEASDRAEERTEKALVAGLDRGTLCVRPCLRRAARRTAVAVQRRDGRPVLPGRPRWSAWWATASCGAALLSWLPWAVSFALYPAFLSYGGWGGGAQGRPPTVAMVVAAALLGIGVHVLVALPGLVGDHEAGRRHLPLRLALLVGAPRLLVLTVVYCALVVGAVALLAATTGLTR